ncbi:pirin family protein [Sandaracinus amylolyticus]|uniref:Pirin-like protein YhhW n=1 Tax=Sandaracinus amylolyticus TaxID=927083 RepID=A0A0F6SHA2_9BACT|nr:pirin-like C-terminal cupin domain-containing protein [Sandaracinus amylolyticus]AKF10089.1 Pirin-like protein YhhW [Sandaracinus amylolyticus]
MSRLLPSIDTPAPSVGFLGAGHTAVAVLSPHDLAASDPFVLITDDRIDLAPGAPIGEAHPHAGLETFTLVLEGSVLDHDEGALDAGDAAWMTAGRGVVHGEHLESRGPTRILQVWIALPAHARGTKPSFRVIRGAPVRRERGAEVRVYGGRSGDVVAPRANVVPITALEVRLDPDASFEQALPDAYGGLVYVVDGSLDHAATGQVAWLDRETESSVVLRAGPRGARVVLLAGERLDEPIVQHGPFVAGSRAEIAEMFLRYRAGRFATVRELATAPGVLLSR